ncbi:MAG: DNA polymerase III subunit gamma/tau [Thermodesulfobacteriota bacterium]
MSYLVLARKYRPQTFQEVVGQEHVTKTLENAINSNRLAHAVLFSGPRGTGKTTVARILAKAMNCKNGPTSIPCNRCESCQEITSGHAVDVMEIDGASNNSVDKVRELRENVKYLPAHSPYKIYIIDEVHMLSSAAFNALLKTIEEPPPHILFIFATTEAHKIPITILSRCQRHDFRRIHCDSISKQAADICAKEGIRIDPESLRLISREASGSMRDALSLLDQVITCTEGNVHIDQVLSLLGIMDRKMIFEISDAVLKKEIRQVLALIEEAYVKGYDLKRFYFELLEHFRDLLVAKIAGRLQNLVDLPSHEVEQILSQAQGVSLTFLSQIADLLFEEEGNIRFASQPRIPFEMAMIKATRLEPALPIESLIERLDAIRTEIFQHPGKKVQNEEKKAGIDSLSVKDQPPEYGKDPDARVHVKSSSALDAKWKDMIRIIMEKSPSLAASLSKCRIVRETDSALEVEVNGTGYDLQAVLKKKHASLFSKACKAAFGKELEIIVVGKPPEPEGSLEKGNNINSIKQKAVQHPLVSDAVRIFGGKVVDVKLL